jgi:hypothetical protein
MKQITTLMMSLFLVSGFISCAQENKDNRPSPPTQVTGKAGNATITISYSAPSVKGRKIFGDLVPYGKIWRAGANEATIFEVDSDVKVEGQALPKGKYGLFTIPGESEWTIVFSKTWNQWGSYRYKQEDDALRVKVKAGASSSLTEKLTYAVNNGVVSLKWEKADISFNVSQ